MTDDELEAYWKDKVYIKETCANFTCPEGWLKEQALGLNAICVGNPWAEERGYHHIGRNISTKCTKEQCCRMNLQWYCHQNYDNIDSNAKCIPMQKTVESCRASCYRKIKGRQFTRGVMVTASTAKKPSHSK